MGRPAELGPQPGAISPPDGEARPARVSPRQRIVDIRHAPFFPEEDQNIVEPDYRDTFYGKVALITGVSHFGGFGYETVRQLIELRAEAVAFNYRVETPGVHEVIADLEQRATATGTRVIPLQADIANFDQADGLVGRVVEQTGHLDIYVANAGVIALGTLAVKPKEEIISELNTNVVGSQLILAQVERQMVSQESGGRVVDISSAAVTGVPEQDDYLATKAFKTAVMRGLALTAMLRRHPPMTHIAVAPGFSRTVMTSIVAEKALPLLLSILGQKEEIPAYEVAKYIVFATSPFAAHFDGKVIAAIKPMAKAG